MSNSYQPIKKLILPLICLLSLFINAATAQADSGILDTPSVETESSKPSEEKRDDKIGSLDFLKGYITVYLLWKNTKHIVFFGTPPFSYVFLDVVDGRSVIIRQQTNVTNNLTSFIKTWENEVTASKACLKSRDITNPLQHDQCIIGRKNIIQLPQGSSPFDFDYTVDWTEANTSKSITARLKPGQKPENRKPLQ
jgi:hypothetical protein